MTSQNTQTKIITNKNITIMKKAIKTAALLAVAMIPVTATAQRNLIKAFDDFTGDKKLKEYIKVTAQTEKDDKSNTTTSFHYSYEFEMPLSKRSCIEPVCEAFNKDSGEAYKTYIKNAGIDDNPFLTIAYGSELDKSMSYGGFIDRNYMVMFVRDSKDSLRRYAYTIIWYTDTAKNMFCGKLEKYYSPDPAIKGNTRGWNVRYYGKGNIIVNTNGKNIIIPNDKIKKDTDFLLRFGNLRATYKKNAKQRGADEVMLNTALISKIVELCDNYGHLLPDSTKEVCIESIRELQSLTADKYLKGFLEEAITKLKK